MEIIKEKLLYDRTPAYMNLGDVIIIKSPIFFYLSIILIFQTQKQFKNTGMSVEHCEIKKP
jgi:exopolysaccharide biosynthesis predicted pyruvyltransferase EpsI